MSITNKLQQIINIKNNIRQAIANKGVSIDEMTPFNDYANKINQIEGGAKPSFQGYGLIQNIKLLSGNSSYGICVEVIENG